MKNHTYLLDLRQRSLYVTIGQKELGSEVALQQREEIAQQRRGEVSRQAKFLITNTKCYNKHEVFVDKRQHILV